MTRRFLTLAISAAAILFVSVPANAVVLYSFPQDETAHGWAKGSSTYDTQLDNLIFQRYADAYLKLGTVVTDFHWWGDQADLVEGFQFEIYTNDATAGKPLSLAYSEYFAGDAGATATGFHGFHKFGIDLSTPFEIGSSGNYWFSVIAHSEAHWSWAMNIDGVHPFNVDWSYSPTAGWSQVPGGLGDFNFEVTGEPIPEPGTLALVGLGLAGLAYRRRRAKQ